MKVIKEFQGVRADDVYPSTIAKGEECPKELIDAAKQLGALEGFDSPSTPALTDAQKAEAKAKGAAPENKAAG